MKMLRPFGAVLLLLIAAACDPCAGVLTCGGPAVRYSGAVELRYTGQPIAGARVEFVRTGGVALERDTVVVTTDAAGRFQLEAGARGSGTATGVVRVTGADGALLSVVSDVQLATSKASGEVRHLGAWRIPYVHVGREGVIFWRAPHTRAPGLEVEFRRTGGVQVTPERFTTRTDSEGLFPFLALPWEAGEIIGELRIRLPAPYDTVEIRDSLGFTAVAGGDDIHVAGQWGVGPHFPYVGRLVWGDTKQLATGVELEFQRTGGVPISPERVVWRSSDNPYGNVQLIPAVPLGYGEVVGDLTVRPPAPYRAFTIEGLRLATSTKDVASAPVVHEWEVPR
jgi:hypothetical protein